MSHRVVQSGVRLVPVVTGERHIQLFAPILQEVALGAGVPRAIGQIVRDAQEGVKSAHGEALLLGQQAKSRVEVAGLPASETFAIAVGLGQRRRRWNH